MGAGILPVVLHNSVLFFLMGKERHNNLLCDFGGGAKHKESVFDTAVREGYEELNGVLGTKYELEKIVNKAIAYRMKKIDYKIFYPEKIVKLIEKDLKQFHLAYDYFGMMK